MIRGPLAHGGFSIKNSAWRAKRRARLRRGVFAFIILLFVFVLPLALAESVVRVIFRDGGRTTSGGPGGAQFEYEYVRPGTDLRTPTVAGPKAPGVERVLILGDSITWGAGVRDWRETYPNRLATILAASRRAFDMEVYARPGKNVDGHASAVETQAALLEPDFVIYQWYVNDLQIDQPLPPRRSRWHDLPGHRWLLSHSWLYFLADAKLSAYVSGRTYEEYLLTHYAPGTPGWTAFADQFHRWAAYSNAYAKHVLMFLYPQVPFRGRYPLEDIQARMRAFAKPHVLSYPAHTLGHDVGDNAADPGAPQRSLRQSDGRDGILAMSPVIPLHRGHYDLGARIRLDQPSTGALGEIQVVSARGSVLARHVIEPSECGAPGQWSTLSAPLDLDSTLTPDIRWLVKVARDARLSVEALSVPMVYDRLEVLDLTDRLNTFNTHASMFDAHPNARAHAAIAHTLAGWVLSKRPTGSGM